MKLFAVSLAGLLAVVCSTYVGATADEPRPAEATSANSDASGAEEPTADTKAPATSHTDSIGAVLVSPVDMPVYYLIGDTLLLQLTAKTDVSVRAIRMVPIGLPNAMFEPSLACEAAGKLRTNDIDDLSLAAGRSLLVSCPLLPRKTWLGRGFGIISKGAKANAIVQIEKIEGDEFFAWEAERVAFQVEPIFLSPLLGAILGATILTLFSQLGPKPIRMSLFRAVATGALVAMILMFGLSAFSGDGATSLPINVLIVDFRGGVLVGIFAHLLRVQIAEKLQLAPPPAPIPAPTPTPTPAPAPAPAPAAGGNEAANPREG